VSLNLVQQIHIPRDLFEESHFMLREIGEEGYEGMVVWAGRRDGGVFSVLAVRLPAQQSTRTSDGLFLLVDDLELHRLGIWLYREKLELIAQVHTHPGAAYHSKTDDAIPIVATRGAISLVIPDFASGPAELTAYSAFRLIAGGDWIQLSTPELTQLICVNAAEEG
jgi:hypothetical protein